MKKCIKRNLYAAVDVMAVVTLLLLLVTMVTRKEKMLITSFVTAGCGVVAGLLQITSGRSKIENKSGVSVYVKPEEGGGAIEVKPGENRYDVDGVRSYNTVYKLGNGCHAVIEKDGSIRVKSITANALVHMRECALATPPDKGWNDIFKIPCHEWDLKKEE